MVELSTLRDRYQARLIEIMGEAPAADFALSVAGAFVLLDVLRRRKARRVLECGAGFSTVLLRTWARAAPHVEILTLEHDKEWRDRIRKILRAEGLPVKGVAPTSYIGTGRIRGLWDVILVDHGPNMQSRLDDLDKLVEVLAPKGAIVLDDFRKRTNYAKDATRRLRALGLSVSVPPRSQSGDRALGVGYRI